MNRHELYDNTANLSPAELEAWENRFAEAERVMGTDAANALKKLYNYYGKEFFAWLARLYDPNTGCFYYSNSARDNEGFLPDCESTAQTFSLMQFLGMFSRYNRDYSKALPEDTVEKCREYLQSLQSPDDGYFYHPQWGSRISSARRGRDYAQCMWVIRSLGGTPIYPTANERLRATSAEYEDSRAELPHYLRTADNMREWLDHVKYITTDKDTGEFDSSSFGHNIYSALEGGQLEQSGLLSVVCDYIDGLQDPKTGFLEKKATYNSTAGIIKIAPIYYAAGRELEPADMIARTCISLILSDANPDCVSFISNPHIALSSALSSLKRINERLRSCGEPERYDVDAIRREIYDKFPRMIDKTIEKLEKFRLPDGSFSYNLGHCAAFTQGVEVAIRSEEGDVNAVACAAHYLLGAIFSYLGISVVPLVNAADFEVFREIMCSVEPAKKKPKEVRYQQVEDFENGGLSWRSELKGNKYHVWMADDPIRINNRTLRWISEEGYRSAYAFNGKEFLDPPESITCFEFESEFFISETAESGDVYTLTLESLDNKVAYTAVLSIEDGTVVLYDTGEYGNPACTDRICALGRLGEWIRLTLLYYPEDDSARIRIYRNGVCIKVSKNYNGSLYMNAEPVRYVTKGRFTNVTPEKSVIFFSSFKTRLYTDRYFGG